MPHPMARATEPGAKKWWAAACCVCCTCTIVVVVALAEAGTLTAVWDTRNSTANNSSSALLPNDFTFTTPGQAAATAIVSSIPHSSMSEELALVQILKDVGTPATSASCPEPTCHKWLVKNTTKHQQVRFAVVSTHKFATRTDVENLNRVPASSVVRVR